MRKFVGEERSERPTDVAADKFFSSLRLDHMSELNDLAYRKCASTTVDPKGGDHVTQSLGNAKELLYLAFARLAEKAGVGAIDYQSLKTTLKTVRAADIRGVTRS